MRYFIYCRKSTESHDRQVLSIESQLSSIKRAFSERSEIEIVGVYEESFSAMTPGRPIFGELIERIKRKEADGIIAWAPDRLARNSIDGGQIVYFLDRGVIKDLKFVTYTFENNSQGKFMLQIMFGQSKYYSDALSENVKRGNRTKLEKGWQPNHVPLGYKNDVATKTVVKDEPRFTLVRSMFELMLAGSHTPKEIALIARDRWGFLTPVKRRSGGGPLALSSIYKILNNPFYAGIIRWNGQSFAGKHEPIVTVDEFNRVRALLKQTVTRRPKKFDFAYTGLLRCGGCGYGITAERKINRYGSRYTYYHCSKPRLRTTCKEPSVELRALEAQIEVFLNSLCIPTALEAWLLEEAEAERVDDQKRELARTKSAAAAFQSVTIQLRELTGLRVRGLLTDQEFLIERKRLEETKIALERAGEARTSPDCIEPLQALFILRNKARFWFRLADEHQKRELLKIVVSNPTLSNKKVRFEAKKPFAPWSKNLTYLQQLGVGDDVHHCQNVKFRRDIRKLIREVRLFANAPDGRIMFAQIKELREAFEPQQEAATQSRLQDAA